MFRILIVLICMAASCTVMGQKPAMYTVYGHVADIDTHAPLDSAWVYLMDTRQNVLDSIQALRKEMNGKDGGYMFNNRQYPEGRYCLKCVYPGYYSPVIPFELKTHKEPLPTAYLRKISPEHNAGGKQLPEEETYAWGTGDEGKTMIEVLKESPAYARDAARSERFEYAPPTDSLLVRVREEFRLDSVAGDGDDVSRIKNLLYWVHNNIEHNGSNGFPEGPRSLSNIYHSSKRNNCGYNCRALAICLAEACLAVGIPARFLTCESKHWDTDGDCHVINVAWSRSLGKWIWVDPSFAAYVTDGNGLLLHPGEVRFRLRHDLPVVLNEDANWNNRNRQTKEGYIDDYMAKNLYILSANMFNQAEPEGMASHRQGIYAALVPQGSNYTNAAIITTDDEWFWQAPEK